MATKIYALRAYYTYGITVKTKDGERGITFRGCQSSNIHGRYMTDNEEIQNALENTKEFKNDIFYLLDDGKRTEVKETASNETKAVELQVKELQNLAEVDDWAKQEFGEDTKFKSSAKAVAWAKEKGYELKFVKK